MSCVNKSIKLLLNDVIQSQQIQTFNSISAFSRRSYSNGIDNTNGQDLYDVLGITKKATAKDIKDAYYELSKIYHPDRNKGCNESANIFRSVSEAYEVLSNYRTRRLYDKGIGSHARRRTTPTTNDEEMNIIVEVEEDDPQTKFYKQHMKRSERPPVQGRSRNYNFDEWTKECITKTFNRQQEFKKNQIREQNSTETENDSMKMFGGGFGIVIGIIVVCIALFDSGTKSNEIDSNTKRKDR